MYIVFLVCELELYFSPHNSKLNHMLNYVTRNRTAICYLLIFILTTAGCTKEFNNNVSSDLGNKKGSLLSAKKDANSLASFQLASGQEIFNAIYFMEGDLVGAIPSLQAYKSQLDEMTVGHPEIVAVKQQFTAELDSIINAQDPNYFANFKNNLSSSDLYVVGTTLQSGATMVETAGKASLKYRNLFKLTDAIMANPTAVSQIENIISQDTAFNTALQPQALRSGGSNSVSSVVGPPQPPTMATSISTPGPSLEVAPKLSEASLSAIATISMDSAPPESELLVCTPGVAVCVYYLIAAAVQYVAAAHSAIAAANVIGYFTLLVKTKAYFWDVTTPSEPLKPVELLSVEIADLLAS